MKEVLVRCGVYFAAAFAVGFGAPLVVQVLLFVYQQVMYLAFLYAPGVVGIPALLVTSP